MKPQPGSFGTFLQDAMRDAQESQATMGERLTEAIIRAVLGQANERSGHQPDIYQTQDVLTGEPGHRERQAKPVGVGQTEAIRKVEP